MRLHQYRPISGKFLAISERSQEIFFLKPVFVEVGNSGLHAYNFEKKRQFCKDFFDIFKILEYPFFSEHFEKSIRFGVFNLLIDSSL